MASGHANRANRPNTWLHRPTCDVKIPLANSEPSTHGTKQRFAGFTVDDVGALAEFLKHCAGYAREPRARVPGRTSADGVFPKSC